VLHSEAVYPGQGLRISAQSRLIRFYAEFGFEPVGEDYLEDDIPHREMVRASR
jgi:ElaA protein